MARYKFKGYTITNCGYHQPDHCVWWEAVNENGEACFHGNTLREVEFEILDYEWEQKIRRKDEEIERLKTMPVGNAAAMREALVKIHDLTNALDEECGVDPVEIRDIARAALAKPARNCDVMSKSTCTKHFSTTYEGNSDGLCDVQTEREKNIHLYYMEFIDWLFAPAAERKGEGDGV